MNFYDGKKNKKKTILCLIRNRDVNKKNKRQINNSKKKKNNEIKYVNK